MRTSVVFVTNNRQAPAINKPSYFMQTIIIIAFMTNLRNHHKLPRSENAYCCKCKFPHFRFMYLNIPAI